MKDWVLDAALLEFGENGVASPFISPYPAVPLNGLIEQFRLDLWHGSEFDLDGEMLDVARVLFYRWSSALLYVLQLEILRNRSRELNQVPLVTSAHFPVVSGGFSVAGLPAELIAPELGRGPVKAAAWRWPGRVFRNRLRSETIYRMPGPLTRSLGVPLVSNAGGPVSRWCSQEGIRAGYWEAYWFFGRPELKNTGHWGKYQAKVREYAASLLGRFECEADAGMLDWLSAQMTQSAGRVEAHLRKLRSDSRSLPKHFLSSATGSMWDRMMRLALRDTGGKVTSFEHGCGSGAFSLSGSFFNDLFCSTEHICYSAKSVELLRESFAGLGQIDLQLPDFFWTGADVDDAARGSAETTADSRVRRVMLVPLGTSGERARGVPLPPDLAAIDINARLTGFLKQQGYTVLLKPHPAHCGPDRQRYADLLGVEVSERPFEQELHNVDLIVTCSAASSTIIAATASHLPLVVLDIGLPPLASGMVQRLSTRAPVVPMYMDENERIQLDWPELTEAIESAQQRTANHAALWF